MTKEFRPTIKTSASTVQDPWGDLKQFTRARIALGRVGSSLPTKEILSFGMSHAMARDAVHLALDTDILQSQIESLGVEVLKLHSRAPDRASYLLRPDWGRRLSDESAEIIKALPQEKIDVSIVIGDGLSSLAVQKHAAPMLQAIQQTMPSEWKLGPVVIASQARVALADEVGELMHARMVILLIGERPGLSSPDSLGLYLTYQPKVGCSDADRNCISNVRPEGLNYEAAAKKLMWLAQESMRLKVSGVALKDESDVHQIDKDAQQLLT
ncbi:ethanolamine ammonia-lyase subunit EutC [Candidatus Methylopumilus turicensis]|uniref:Ethanolamine ammonia-lyase small subunit n=1 Tax=Candidatus Methylopumilus turicensis TaxID=1581680 RepID=A0A0B7J266_9PROT|nr:ethanolamine ammonia-lyase subunit EutC [Candidatus Methylopumilus turicensis]CEN56734.1 Ethanolamine ammonia-lyase light chain [Candidatus Methylopumilus turicensis]